MRWHLLFYRIINKWQQTSTPKFILSRQYFFSNTGSADNSNFLPTAAYLRDPARFGAGCQRPLNKDMIAWHRKLFFLSFSPPVNFLVNTLAYFRWVGFYAWFRAYKASQKQTNTQLASYGISRQRLFIQLVKLGLIHLIPPYYYFKYQLYKPENHPLAFFYDQQLPYFHNLSNKSFKQYKDYAALIADKQKFSSELEKIGIPTPQGNCYQTQILKKNLGLLFKKKSIFCKPNKGAQSRDAFLIDYDSTSGCYLLAPIDGQKITCQLQIDRYLQSVLARNTSLLLQEAIDDHDIIKKISGHHASTTVRVITAKNPAPLAPEVNLLYIQLEIPMVRNKEAGSNSVGWQEYMIVPLDLLSLEIDSHYKQHSVEIQRELISISADLKLLLRETIFYCVSAHEKLLELRTVAFDVIIGQQGPVIIEANYNWSIEMLYSVLGYDKSTMNQSHPAYQWMQQVLQEDKGTRS